MKKKILILFLTLFLLFLAGVAIALYMVFHTTKNLDALVSLHKVEIIRQELVINVQTVQSNLYATGTQFGKELDVIVNNVIDLSRAAKECGSCHHEPAVAEDIENLQEMSTQYREALSYFITSTADEKRIARLQTVAADIGDSIIEKSQTMALNANDSLRRKTIEASEKVKKSKDVLVGTIITSFFLSLAIAVYLIKSITRPVAELIDATRKIRTGKLGYLSSYQGKDEFKELFASFNDMSSTLQQKNEEIMSYMVRNQTILQTSTDGFALLNEQGEIIDINPALSEMTEYSADELFTLNFMNIAEMESGVGLSNLFERIRESDYLIFQMDLRRKKGSLIAVEISATFALMEGEGRFFCFIRNITERKKMEAEIQKVQKLESLGVLAGGIAHDFNNLLTAILGNIELAKRRIEPEADANRFLDNARKASDRAQNLTQQLLTFSRGGEPIKQPLKVVTLIEEATGFVLSGSNVRCDLSLSENLWLVNADKGQLSQVIQNITINASQAMPDGGVITISADNIVADMDDPLLLPGGNYVRITFVDQGVGIPGKYISRIFDPYFTTKQAGNGLGLTICYSIITKHDGKLKVESEPGVGTTFTVYLPALEKEGQPEADLEKDSVVMGTGRVLVMDDEEDVRIISSEMLKDLGYEPEVVKDGVAAIKLYKEAMESGQPYLAVIMDLTIPGGMGGKEAITELLRIDPEVKGIVSSGYSYDPIMAEHWKYGFSGVVTKPYDIEQLSKTLQDMLTK